MIWLLKSLDVVYIYLCIWFWIWSFWCSVCHQTEVDFLHLMMSPTCSLVLSCPLVRSTSSYRLIYQNLDILTWNVLVSCTHRIRWSFSLSFSMCFFWIHSSLIHLFSSTSSLSSLRWKLIDYLHLSHHHWLIIRGCINVDIIG